MHIERIIGQYDGNADGPLLVFIAGIHGNETSGVRALQEIFNTLESERPSIFGSIVGLAGNCEAIRQEVRYVGEDLNRIWSTEESKPELSEYRERDELTETLNSVLSANHKEVCFFDLHSTSAGSPPFIMLSDTLRNRELGRTAGVPMILGLLEHLKGMLIEVTSRCGFPTILFQGGRDGDVGTLTNFKGMICKILMAKCQLDTTNIPDFETSVKQLDSFAPANKDNEFFEITYSHKIRRDIKFEMKPDFVGFQPVKKGEVMATVDGRELRSPETGLLLMPLKQEQSSEGFYIIKPIASFWIKLSKKFKLFKNHNGLDWLAGVKKINSNPLTFKVDEQITYFWALEIFHLLGYIKVHQDGPLLYMSRREDETSPPTSEDAIQKFKQKSFLRSGLNNIEPEWRVPFSKR